MKYIVDYTQYCMLRDHRCGTFYDNLRYGLASGCLDTVKIYDCRSRDMVKKSYKYIRSYKEVKKVHKFTEKKDSTWELSTTEEGKPRGEMDEVQNVSKYKYVRLIPHEYCPGNYMVLEIFPWENNSSVPETTTKVKKTEVIRGRKLKQINRNYLKNYRRIRVNTLQVPRILNMRNSVLWKLYSNRIWGRRLITSNQEIERLSHVCESEYVRYARSYILARSYLKEVGVAYNT